MRPTASRMKKMLAGPFSGRSRKPKSGLILRSPFPARGSGTLAAPGRLYCRSTNLQSKSRWMAPGSCVGEKDGPTGDQYRAGPMYPGDRLFQEHRRENDDNHDAQFVNGRHLGRFPELQRSEVAEP